MVLVAIDAASVKRNKIKLTCSAGVFASIRRSWGSVAVAQMGNGQRVVVRVVIVADGWWWWLSTLQWEIKPCNGRGGCVAVEDGRVAETKLKHCNGGRNIAMTDR